MAEGATSFTDRARSLARHPKTKLAGLGGGGAGILVLIYELFVTKAEFADYKHESVRKASVQWQKIMDLDSALDNAKLDIVRLQTLLERTNTP